jgi:hypothetical protein
MPWFESILINIIFLRAKMIYPVGYWWLLIGAFFFCLAWVFILKYPLHPQAMYRAMKNWQLSIRRPSFHAQLLSQYSQHSFSERSLQSILTGFSLRYVML